MKLNTFRLRLVAALLTVFIACPALRAQESDAARAAGSTNNSPVEAAVPEAATNDAVAGAEQRGRIQHGPTITFGTDAILKEGELAEVVVAIGGSARAFGKVKDVLVAIGGDAVAGGDVGEVVVAVGGNATAKGRVGEVLVAVAGDAEAQGEVGENVVAVMGNVRIGSNAVVRGEVISVGGKVDVEPGGQVQGKVTEVGVGPLLIPLKGAADWLRHCALKFRLLAPQPSWFWVIPGLYLIAYLLITLAFPRPVAACANELTHRPATTFLLGLLTELLVPLVVAVLAITGIGAVVVPFIYVALFIGGLIGKAALFQFLGRQFARVFGVQLAPPVLALLVGVSVITLLYMVPFVCLLVYVLIALWGIGAAVTATFGGMRRESPLRFSSASASFGIPTVSPVSAAAGSPVESSNFAGVVPPVAGAVPMSPPLAAIPEGESPEIPKSPAAVPPIVSEALALTRAGFWERMGAAFLDVIIVSILGALVGGPPLGFLVALAYFAGMWAWKGTTVGGVVLNLKVVRLDDKPVTFTVALVRGLFAGFSVIVLFLGFLWMIWDREKQTWHDKIAGTVVIRLPRGMPLVCL